MSKNTPPHHHHPRKRFGQNFLHDPDIVAKIIDALNLHYDDHVVEIGPGLGALTQYMLPSLKSLDAIEIDRDLIPKLAKLGDKLGQLHLYEQDVLTLDFAKLVTRDEKLRIVGNLPYNISTPLLFHLFKSNDLITDMHFMLQKEVAERLRAEPGSKVYGRLSVMAQYYCQIKILFAVPPQAFRPPPKVNSCFVSLKPHLQLPYLAEDVQLFGELVRAAFSQRRKILKNSIKDFLSAEQISELGIDPHTRAEQLTIENFVKMSNKAMPPLKKGVDEHKRGGGI